MSVRLLALLVSVGAFVLASSSALGWQEGKVLGRAKVHRAGNAPPLVGIVTELADEYKIETRPGMTMTIPKSQVRSIEMLGAEAALPVSARATDITPDEIDAILGSVPWSDLKQRAGKVDLSAPLDLDRDSLQEMLRIAGPKAKYLETPHFVFVYTSPREQAAELGARLESVYRWCVTYSKQLKLVQKLPRGKLEIFYFGTFEEYQAYQTLNGWMSMGALGFYMRTNNRAAFYDMNKFPPVAAELKRIESPGVPPEERQRTGARYRRWAEHTNLEVVQHEAAHQIHFNVGIFPKMADLPRWMTEGLATMFEVPPNEAGASLGTINHSRLGEFRESFGEKGENIPWELVRLWIFNDTPGYQAYVMGWALNQYLRTKHTEAYGKWLRALNERPETLDFAGLSDTTKQEQFEDAFGIVDEAWVQKFMEYMASLEYRRSLDFRTQFP